MRKCRQVCKLVKPAPTWGCLKWVIGSEHISSAHLVTRANLKEEVTSEMILEGLRLTESIVGRISMQDLACKNLSI